MTVHLLVIWLMVPPPLHFPSFIATGLLLCATFKPLLTLEPKSIFRQASSWPAISLSLWLEMDRRYGAMIRTAGPSISMRLRVKAQIPFKACYPFSRKAIMTKTKPERGMGLFTASVFRYCQIFWDSYFQG